MRIEFCYKSYPFFRNTKLNTLEWQNLEKNQPEQFIESTSLLLELCEYLLPKAVIIDSQESPILFPSELHDYTKNILIRQIEKQGVAFLLVIGNENTNKELVNLFPKKNHKIKLFASLNEAYDFLGSK